MISIDSKIEIYLYGGSTDMRKGIHGLAMLIEENIEKKCGKVSLSIKIVPPVLMKIVPFMYKFF